MEKTKLIASIIIRAYNDEATIARAIESALAQDFPHQEYEIIVVDDGSTDGTAKVVGGYLFDRRLRFVRQDNGGIVRAANAGIAAAAGKYITFLDSDDTFDPQLLLVLVPILDAKPKLALVYPDYWEERDGERTRVSPRHVFEALNGGILFRKSALVDIGGYRNIPVFPEYDLFLRVLDKWSFEHYAERTLMTYTRRQTSITSNTDGVRRAIEKLKELHPDKLTLIETIRSYD